MNSEAGKAVAKNPSLYPSFCYLLPADAPGQRLATLFHLFPFSPEPSLLFHVVSLLNEALVFYCSPLRSPWSTYLSASCFSGSEVSSIRP